MRRLNHWLPGLLAAAWLVAAPAVGQDDMSERERRRAAREEQRKERMNAEQQAAQAAREKEQAEEQARLEALGVDEVVLLEGERGFFVALDAFFADPSGAERTIARVGDVVSSATTVGELDTDGNGAPDAFSIQNERPLRLEYDGELAPQVEIGWRKGTGASFSVRYWSYSSDASASATSTFTVPDAMGETGLIVGGIDNQGFENAFGSGDTATEAFARPYGSPGLPIGEFTHGADSVTASGSLDATRFDLLYTHVGLVRPRIELGYRIGLSLLQAERQETATFTWRSYSDTSVRLNALAVENLSSTADTQGLGLLVGVSGRFGLTQDRRWSLRAGLELSGLTNEQDLSFRDAWTFTQDGLDEPITTVAQDSTSEPSKSLITTIDADVALEGRFGESLRLAVGYRHASWLEALTEERYPDGANRSLLLSEGLDLDFGGPYLRLSWFF